MTVNKQGSGLPEKPFNSSSFGRPCRSSFYTSSSSDLPLPCDLAPPCTFPSNHHALSRYLPLINQAVPVLVSSPVNIGYCETIRITVSC